MLTAAKPVLQNSLLSMLINAYMTQFTSSLDPDGSSVDGEAKSKMQQKATDFAKAAAGPTADAIYKFVKEIGIDISIPPSVIAPPLPPTLPGGACKGMISMNNVKIS